MIKLEFMIYGAATELIPQAQSDALQYVGPHRWGEIGGVCSVTLWATYLFCSSGGNNIFIYLFIFGFR